MSIEDAREFYDRELKRDGTLGSVQLMDAYATAQNRELQEKVHKADGMANEINILTRANRELQERVEKLEKENETLHAVAADVNSMTHGQ